jgi:hypothetical protein
MKFLTLVGLSLLSSLPGLGAPITVTFFGLISDSTLPGIAVGDSFNGLMTFETSASVLGSGGNYVNYGSFLPADGATVTVDGFTFSGASYLNLLVSNGPGGAGPVPNTDFVAGSSDGLFGTLSTNYSGLRLDGVDAQFVGNLNFLGSNAIPNPFDSADVIPGTTAVPTLVFVQLDNGTSNSVFHGYISSVTAIPEPGTLPLVFLSLGSLILLRPRQSTYTRRTLAPIAHRML